MASKSGEVLVMYILLRKDLITLPKWTMGSVITQAAHAASACIWEYRNDDGVQRYMSSDNIDHMTKVTLGIEDAEQLKTAIDILRDNNVDHRVWREDDMDVCVAVKPLPRGVIQPILKRFPLYK